MRPGRVLAAWAAIAGLPDGLLLLLVAARLLAAPAGMVALVLTSLGGLAVALVWEADCRRLATLALLAQEEQGAQPGNAPIPRLLPMRMVAREIDQMARTLASRAALIRRLLKADEAIVELLPDPLIVLGADRAVRRANAAARESFGADMAAVLRHPGLRAAIDRAYAGQNTQSAALTLSVPAAREVQATVITLDPPLADGGQAIIVLSDRTRERAIERMRADFVANASHELRTPLASLIGFIDTLRGPARDDPPAQTRFLGIMAEQAQRMTRLIDDLLSLSRIELVEHQPPAGVVDLAELVRRLAAGFEPRVAARRITLRLDLEPDLPRIAGDADQLSQVLQNLLDNAVKYGREGGTVHVRAARAEGEPRWPASPGVALSVQDDGQGIAPEHLPRLTERFYRADKGRSRAVGGTGLGLAIVKHIVNRHRGQLRIESEEGRGSIFSVWLPLADKPSPPAAVPDETAGPHAAVSGPGG